jgi:hypothetical protein
MAPRRDYGEARLRLATTGDSSGAPRARRCTRIVPTLPPARSTPTQVWEQCGTHAGFRSESLDAATFDAGEWEVTGAGGTAGFARKEKG